MENSSLVHENHYPPSPSSAANGLRHRSSPPITRSDPNNPYPTTFVQADTSSFKQVVQMLTGSTEASSRAEPVRSPIPPMKRKDKSSSKLYERRNSLKNFKISPLAPAYSGSASPRPEILSPSILDFPSLALSPVTPLIPDPFNRATSLNIVAEDKAIKEKGFYLHPSPARDSEPRLLPLFPVTSPRVAPSSTPVDSST